MQHYRDNQSYINDIKLLDNLKHNKFIDEIVSKINNYYLSSESFYKNKDYTSLLYKYFKDKPAKLISKNNSKLIASELEKLLYFIECMKNKNNKCIIDKILEEYTYIDFNSDLFFDVALNKFFLKKIEDILSLQDNQNKKTKLDFLANLNDYIDELTNKKSFLYSNKTFLNFFCSFIGGLGSAFLINSFFNFHMYIVFASFILTYIVLYQINKLFFEFNFIKFSINVSERAYLRSLKFFFANSYQEISSNDTPYDAKLHTLVSLQDHKKNGHDFLDFDCLIGSSASWLREFHLINNPDKESFNFYKKILKLAEDQNNLLKDLANVNVAVISSLVKKTREFIKKEKNQLFINNHNFICKVKEQLLNLVSLLKIEQIGKDPKVGILQALYVGDLDGNENDFANIVLLAPTVSENKEENQDHHYVSVYKNLVRTAQILETKMKTHKAPDMIFRGDAKIRLYLGMEKINDLGLKKYNKNQITLDAKIFNSLNLMYSLIDYNGYYGNDSLFTENCEFVLYKTLLLREFISLCDINSNLSENNKLKIKNIILLWFGEYNNILFDEVINQEFYKNFVSGISLFFDDQQKVKLNSHNLILVSCAIKLTMISSKKQINIAHILSSLIESFRLTKNCNYIIGGTNSNIESNITSIRNVIFYTKEFIKYIDEDIYFHDLFKNMGLYYQYLLNVKKESELFLLKQTGFSEAKKEILDFISFIDSIEIIESKIQKVRSINLGNETNPGISDVINEHDKSELLGKIQVLKTKFKTEAKNNRSNNPFSCFTACGSKTYDPKLHKKILDCENLEKIIVNNKNPNLSTVLLDIAQDSVNPEELRYLLKEYLPQKKQGEDYELMPRKIIF